MRWVTSDATAFNFDLPPVSIAITDSWYVYVIGPGTQIFDWS